MHVVNPMNLFISDETLNQSLQLLDAFGKGTLPTGTTDEALWRARAVKEAVLHPDTGEKIPAVARMAAFIPANVPICAGMLIPNASIATTIFWQWVNQSYNVMVNYANRNASTEQSTATIATAYTLATGTALAVSLGARKIIATHGHKWPPIAGRVFPYLAVAAAGTVGLLIIRAKEMSDGVHVKDHDGTNHGLSPAAGRIAVAKTALTRSIVFPMAPLLVPPIVMDLLKRIWPALSKNPRLAIPVELVTIIASMGLCLPAVIAAFPQEESVPAAWLEPKFRALRDSRGQPITEFTFNRGL